MLPWFILGVAILAGLLLAGRWFVDANPKTVIKALKWGLIAVIVAVALFFVVTGRLFWAFAALPALIPWLMRARMAHNVYKTFSRMRQSSHGGFGGAGSGGASGSGRESDVETRFLRMALDHDTGAMTGEVLEGAYAGRRVESLAVTELVALLRVCWTEDPPSAQVLESYLDRQHPDWRREAGDQAGPGPDHRAGGGAMTRAEALDVLGLDEGASEKDVRDAHHRLIAGLHPDRGGSTYLAAKINQAKDVLLGR